MKVKNRKFKITDSKIVAELIKNLYLEDPGGKPMSLQKIQNTFDSLLKHPDRGTIIVLEYDREIIGYSILINFWSNEFGGNILVLDELYIKEEFRSRSIGTNFIKSLVNNRFGSSVALQLEVSSENNSARKLYEKLGFNLHKNDTMNLDLE